MKNNKAITLIALIITIIVLLILATVTINIVLGDNGLFNKAKTSVAKYENAQEKENSTLTGYENAIGNYINGNRDYEEEINTLKARITELENANSYSTQDRIIGKWINGEDLYQKTYIIKTPNVLNSNEVVATMDNIANKMIVDIKGILLPEDGPYTSLDRPYSNQESPIWVRKNGEIAMNVENDLQKNCDGYVTIQYIIKTNTTS